jgi:hypothetical protein
MIGQRGFRLDLECDLVEDIEVIEDEFEVQDKIARQLICACNVESGVIGAGF